nr:MAG TPA: hypothetical protein [Caudoviricetes sp.]
MVGGSFTEAVLDRYYCTYKYYMNSIKKENELGS